MTQMSLAPKAIRPVILFAMITLCFVFLIDAQIFYAVAQWPSSERAFFHLVSRTGMADWILIPAIAFALCTSFALLFHLPLSIRWATQSLKSLSWLVLIGVGSAGITVQILKRIIGRARPMFLEQFGSFHFEPFTSDWAYHSFPSGHTTTAFALAFLILAVWGHKLGMIAYAWAILVGVARLSEGAHFMSDVLGGVVCGTVCAVLTWRQFQKHRFPVELKNGARINHTPKLFARAWQKVWAKFKSS